MVHKRSDCDAAGCDLPSRSIASSNHSTSSPMARAFGAPPNEQDDGCALCPLVARHIYPEFIEMPAIKGIVLPVGEGGARLRRRSGAQMRNLSRRSPLKP